MRYYYLKHTEWMKTVIRATSSTMNRKIHNIKDWNELKINNAQKNTAKVAHLVANPSHKHR